MVFDRKEDQRLACTWSGDCVDLDIYFRVATYHLFELEENRENVITFIENSLIIRGNVHMATFSS